MAAPSPLRSASQQAHSHSVPRTAFPCSPASFSSRSSSPATSSSSAASSSSSSSSTPLCGLVGNDPLDPKRLTLINGINNGDFIIGPPIQPVNGTPIRNISEHLAKRDGVNEFVVLKVLKPTCDASESSDDNQGKVLLYNELSVLSLLQDQPGVIHQHGFFRERNHFILVLDCLIAHEYDKSGLYKHFENLQHYVIHEKKLSEREALEVFSSAVATVNALHKKNIVHRDLKLGNMILNKRTREVTLTSFVLSKHLVRDGEQLTDQRGSLAYVSPDVLSGRPYNGKASDMWAMGVLLYTMVYGQFPFYDTDPQELFRKIKTAKYTIPEDGHVSMKTVSLIKGLLELEPGRRVGAQQALEATHSILGKLSTNPENDLSAQIVPDLDTRMSVTAFDVPTKNDDTSSSQASLLANLRMTEVQLINPSSPLDLHGAPISSPVRSGPVPFPGSPVHATAHRGFLTSDPSPPYIINTSTPPPFPHPPLPPPPPPHRSSSGNTFSFTSDTASSSSSCPPFPGGSPANSPGFATSNPLAIPPQSPAHTASHSHSFSAPFFACHRPVGPSQSLDSYFDGNAMSRSLPASHAHSSTHYSPQHSSHHSPPQHTSHISPQHTSHFSPQHTSHFSPQHASHFSPPHTHSAPLPSVSESEQRAISTSLSYVISNPIESLVTVRSPNRPTSAGNRPVYMNGDGSSSLNLRLTTPPRSLSLQNPRQRRNSSGSQENSGPQVRRSSHTNVVSPGGPSDPPSSSLPPHFRGSRRRSQDAHMDRDDIIVHFGPLSVNQRRRSRSNSREPYHF